MNPINQDPNAQYLVYTNQAPTQKPKKKKHGCLISFLVVLGLLIGGGAVATPFAIKEVKYRSAELLVAAEEFDNAVVMFDSLGDYKDAKDKITNTKYLQAQSFGDSEDYEYAIEILQELGDYKDSAELTEEYAEKYMDTLVAEKEYGDLEDYLDTVSDMDFSSDFEDLRDYYNAVLLYSEKEYEDAADAFEELDDVKDSEKFYAMSMHKYYEENMKLVSLTQDIMDTFTTLYEYKDDSEVKEMLKSNLYDLVKLMGEWESEDGKSIVYTEGKVEFNIPVQLNPSKNYYVFSQDGIVVAVDADALKSGKVTENHVVVLFEIISFDDPYEESPKEMKIFNVADNKEYTFTRTK